MAFNFNDFMTRVKVDNPQFKRFTRSSSLDPLILELKDKLFFTQVLKEKIERIIAFLPFDKQKQYDKSLAYLSKELNIRVGAIPCNPVMKFVKFRIIPGMFTGYNTQNESKTFSLDRSPESIGPRSFVHVHRISWSSSNGNAQSLSTVRTREHVKFLEDTQSKPFNNIQDPDREFYHPA